MHGGVYSILNYPWRCIFYNELCMEVYILDDFWILIQVNSSGHFGMEEVRAVRHFVRSPRRLMSEL